MGFNTFKTMYGYLTRYFGQIKSVYIYSQDNDLQSNCGANIEIMSAVAC